MFASPNINVSTDELINPKLEVEIEIETETETEITMQPFCSIWEDHRRRRLQTNLLHGPKNAMVGKKCAAKIPIFDHNGRRRLNLLLPNQFQIVIEISWILIIFVQVVILV